MEAEAQLIIDKLKRCQNSFGAAKQIYVRSEWDTDLPKARDIAAHLRSAHGFDVYAEEERGSVYKIYYNFQNLPAQA